MATLEVYSRHGCHLCEQLIEELLPLVRGYFDVDVRDIDSREAWQQRYDVRVPVVEFEGRVICEYHLDRPAIDELVAEQGSREQ
jgi:hypothetical protein